MSKKQYRDSHFKGPIDEDWWLWMRLRRVASLTTIMRSMELQKHGISLIQSAIIIIVHNAKSKVRPIDIARLMSRRRHTITELLNRMVAAGLIVKVRDSVKKNQINIKLTEKADTLYYKATKTQSISAIFSVLTDAERSNVISILGKLEKATLKFTDKLENVSAKRNKKQL
ncbi:MarR family winged helix-turn-helix transcriptional regulator [Chloroflexota bacterium]